MYGKYANILRYIDGKCYHIWHTWILWGMIQYDHLQSVLTHISIELPFCHVDDDQNPVSNQYQMLAT